MRILYFGNGVRGVKCLETLVNNNENIIGVVAHPNPESTVAHLARELGLPVYQPERVNASSFVDEVVKLYPDLSILSGYNQILKKRIISIPKHGTINLHGGKLPEYRGVAPINWQIINGETTGGCAIIYVDEGIDTGDIIVQEYYDISLEDTAATVVEKTLEIFPRLLIETLEKIKTGTVKRIKQNVEEGCYYTRRYPRDGKIDWKSMTAMEVYNLVRALVKPYPGAFTYHGDAKIIIWKASLLREKIKGVPGRVPLKLENGVVVIAKDFGLLIEEISVGESEEVINPRQYFSLGDDLS